ncbi:MAG: hypothetical protein LC624_08255 [Halobacteriales archaeon]|nr:hypothetical protein [Halobacteriales archaeon]
MRALLLLLALLPALPAAVAPADSAQSCGPYLVPESGTYQCQLQSLGENAGSYIAAFGIAPHPATGQGTFAGRILVTGSNLQVFGEDCTGSADANGGMVECHTCIPGNPAGDLTAQYQVGARVPPAQLCTPLVDLALLLQGAVGEWTGYLVVPGPG